MSKVPGDVEIESIKIGDYDLSDNKLTLGGFNIYESAIHHHTFADITILDANDILGTKQFAGDEEVEIKFKHPGEDKAATFKFALLENAKLKHNNNMRMKTYELRCVSPEYLKAQNKVVNKSWNTQTSNIVKDVVKDFWETKKEVKIKKDTKSKQTYISNSKSPHTVINHLKHRHVSQDHKEDGSLYSLYETRNDNGEQEIHFDTFHNMMKNNETDLEFIQDTTIHSDLTSSKDFNNILKVNIASSFYTPDRFRATGARSTYCLATGKQQKEDAPFKDPDIPLSKSPIRDKQVEQINKPPKDQKPQRSRLMDPSNQKEQTFMPQSDPYKASMLARLTNDVSTMIVPGNIKLKVGQVISVKLTQKANLSKQSGDLDNQISEKVLITGLRHVINPQSDDPQYVCVVEFIKAGWKKKADQNA